MQRRETYKMFYKQFLEAKDVFNPEFVENFDYWLTTLPENNQKNITASVVSSRLGVQYMLADLMLKFAERKGILQKYYLVKCPDCDFIIDVISKDEIASRLIEGVYCSDCEEIKVVQPNNIYEAYKVIKHPDVTEEEIAKAIVKRLGFKQGDDINFNCADSLLSRKNILYEAFYSPDESAYKEFKRLRDELDADYGKNTTSKGSALEKLVLEIVGHIKYVEASDKVRTGTNQFDCTALCGISTPYPSVFNTLAPYFIIECKNETEKKPDNNYCNKLLSIIDTNEAKLGIIWARKDVTSTCFTIAREHYLAHSRSKKDQIIITFSDEDLKEIIDNRVNLLQYIEYKILRVTSNSKTCTYEMFLKTHKEE